MTTEPTKNAGEAADRWRDYDHVAFAANPDPGPEIQRMREGCPVGRSERYGGFWVLNSWADTRDAARDPELMSSSVLRGPGPGFPYSALFPVPRPLIGSDPPVHRDFRIPLMKTFFTPAAADAMEPEIRAIVTRLIDAFIERGEADLAAELCTPLPALATSSLLDLPEDSRSDMVAWAKSISADGPETDAYAQMERFVDELYDVRVDNPGTDIPSFLLSISVEGRSITRPEWVGLVLALIVASLDTTANGGALMLHILAQHPEIRADLAAHPEKLSLAVEELLRLAAPVPQNSRGATRDCEFSGQQIKAGDVVLLNWQAANRDPAQFPDPDAFVPDRSPNQHQTFGFGPHRCIGAHVAKVELRTMLEEVLRRLPDYVVIPERVKRYSGLDRGMSELGVTFTPGPRES